MSEGEEITFNLRDAYEAKRWRRAKVAINLLKKYVKRVAKVENVKLSDGVNRYIWSRGAERPPRKITVVIEREEDTAEVRLKGEQKAGE